MKRNSLKTVFSAVVFTLAIAASFAFSPALNDAEDQVVNGYIQVTNPLSCVKVDHNCIKGTEANCTVTLIGGEAPVLQHRPQYTICTDQLTRPF